MYYVYFDSRRNNNLIQLLPSELRHMYTQKLAFEL